MGLGVRWEGSAAVLFLGAILGQQGGYDGGQPWHSGVIEGDGGGQLDREVGAEGIAQIHSA